MRAESPRYDSPMPQSLCRVLTHLVFSTKHREPVLTLPIQAQLHPYLATVLANDDCPALQVGGVEDHVHLLFGLSRTRTIAQMVEKVKTSSSKWMKTQGSEFGEFHWQAGYGAFSVSPKNEDAAIAYIRNQAEHHRHVSFQEEYRDLLKKCGVAFDERYVWD